MENIDNKIFGNKQNAQTESIFLADALLEITGQTHEMGEKENEIIKLFEQNEISTEQ